MMSSFDFLILICAIGTAVMAGVFFAFSTSVMKGLSRLPAEQGMAAMQSINTVILNPVFLGVFLGTALACAVAVVVCLLYPDSAGRAWVIGGAMVYLLGAFFVTMRFNVPRNEKLVRMSVTAPEAPAVWREYLQEWTAWNHVRTVASLLAAILFLLTAFR